MNSDVRRKMLLATEKTRDLPTAVYFRHLPVVGIDCSQEYYDIVNRPISFEQITEKIKNNQYVSIEEWQNDIAQIWKNCEIYNGNESFLTLVTKELAKTFERYSRDVVVLTTDGFCKESYRLQAKLGKLLSNPPLKGIPAFAYQTTPLRQIVKKLPSEKELSNLVMALDLVTEDSDIEKARQIVSKNQPDLLKKNITTIDVTQLKIETVKELQIFLTDTLAKQGLHYPN